MCKFASIIIMQNGETFWVPGVDSHSEILRAHTIDDSVWDETFAKVEVIPSQNRPVSEWLVQVDDKLSVRWWDARYERAAISAVERLLKEEAKGWERVNEDGSWATGKRKRGIWVFEETMDSLGNWRKVNYDSRNGSRHERWITFDGDWGESFTGKGFYLQYKGYKDSSWEWKRERNNGQRLVVERGSVSRDGRWWKSTHYGNGWSRWIEVAPTGEWNTTRYEYGIMRETRSIDQEGEVSRWVTIDNWR